MQTGVFMSQDDLETVLAEAVRRTLEENGAIGSEDGWLNREGAARYLSMTPAAIDAATTRGQLPVHRGLTGRRRYRRSELDEFATARDDELARST
jgi:hypothetical protein